MKYLAKISDKYKIALLYFMFYIFVLGIHLPMKRVSDDIRFAAFDAGSVFNVFKYYWSVGTGKYLSDGIGLFAVKMPFFAWKLIDSFVYCIIAESIYYLSGKERIFSRIIICIFLLMFPFHYMNSAGYVVTTASYVYPFLGLLLALIPFQNIYNKKRTNIVHLVLALAGGAIAGNQEQTLFVLMSVSVCLTCLMWKKLTGNNRIKTISLIVVYLCEGLFFFLSPGHLSRMTDTYELNTYLPQFAGWSVLYKALRGISSTFAVILFSSYSLFWVLSLLIGVLGVIRKKYIFSIPICVMGAVRVIGCDRFVTAYEYSYGMPDAIYPVNDPGFIRFGIACILIVGFSMLAFFMLTSGEKRRFLFLAMSLSLASRFMMGFSCTIFASSYRTFSLLSFGLIIICISICDSIADELNSRTGRTEVRE